MMRLPAVLALLFALLPACRSLPELPPVEGRGLIAFDPTPPEGAELFPCPEWTLGERRELLRGGQQRLTLTITRADGDGYLLTDGASGARLWRSRELANLGEFPPSAVAEQPLRRLAPADLRFHWPLWVGKRWRCHYVDKAVTGMVVPQEVAYEVEAIDTIRVPAGTFRCLRILRTARPTDVEGRFFDSSAVVWYCPELGMEVRQLVDGRMEELVSWTRPAPPAGS